MSSVELSELCVGRGKDDHSNFMKKARKVLGEEQVVNFYELQTYMKGNNSTGTRNILRLPEREACLLAMSYSYELQARVYDAWVAQREALISIAASETHEEAVSLANDVLSPRDQLIALAIKGNKEGLYIGKRVSKALQESTQNPSEMIDTLTRISKGMSTVSAQSREAFWISSRTTVDKLREHYRRNSKEFSTMVYDSYEKVMHYCTKRVAQVRKQNQR